MSARIFERRHVTDDALFAGYRDRGDETALATLVARHWERCFRLALAVVRDRSTAEDVAQEAFVRVVEAAQRGKVIETFEGWLPSVVLNEARKHLRSGERRARREVVASERRSEEKAVDPIASIREYTDALPEKLRLPLVLHFGLGLTHAEVARTIGRPAQTITSQIQTGIERLRASLVATGAPVLALEVTLAAAFAETRDAQAPAAPSTAMLVRRARSGWSFPGAKALAFATTTVVGLAVAMAIAWPAASATSPAGVLLADSAGGGMMAPVVSNPPIAARETPDLTPGSASVSSDTGGAGANQPEGRDGTQGTGPATPAWSGVNVAATGRVLDADGRPVAGAHVTIAVRRDWPDHDLHSVELDKDALAPVPLDSRADVIKGAMAASGKIVRLAEIESAADGGFHFVAGRATFPRDGITLLVIARTEVNHEEVSGSRTLELDSPSVALDFNADVTITRRPRLTVAVRGAYAGSRPQVLFRELAPPMPVSTRVEVDETGLARFAAHATCGIVTVRSPGSATEQRRVLIDSLDVRLAIDLTPESLVRGRILDDSGHGIPGVQLVALADDMPRTELIPEEPQDLTATTVTTADGSWEIRGLAAGRTYHMHALPQEINFSRKSFDVTPPARDLVLVLQRLAKLAVKIQLQGGGKPDAATAAHWLTPARVSLERMNASGEWEEAVTEDGVENGHLVFGVRPGTFRVRQAPGEGFAGSFSKPVTVVAGQETASALIELVPGRTITGHVRDERGAPIAAACVLFGPLVGGIDSYTREDGGFELKEISPEGVVLEISKVGYKTIKVTALAGIDLVDAVLVAEKF